MSIYVWVFLHPIVYANMNISCMHIYTWHYIYICNIYICIYIHINIYTYIVYMNIYMYAYMHIHIYTYIHIYMYICIYAYTWEYVCKYIFTSCLNMHTHVRIHTCLYIWIAWRMHMYAYVSMHTNRCSHSIDSCRCRRKMSSRCRYHRSANWSRAWRAPRSPSGLYAVTPREGTTSALSPLWRAPLRSYRTCNWLYMRIFSSSCARATGTTTPRLSTKKFCVTIGARPTLSTVSCGTQGKKVCAVNGCLRIHMLLYTYIYMYTYKIYIHICGHT